MFLPYAHNIFIEDFVEVNLWRYPGNAMDDSHFSWMFFISRPWAREIYKLNQTHACASGSLCPWPRPMAYKTAPRLLKYCHGSEEPVSKDYRRYHTSSKNPVLQLQYTSRGKKVGPVENFI